MGYSPWSQKESDTAEHTRMYMCCVFFIQSSDGYLGCVCILTIVNGAAKNKVHQSVSHSVMSDSATLKTVAHQAPLSMGFLIQEYWSGLPFPSPGDLPKPGIEPRSPALQVDSLPPEPPAHIFQNWCFSLLQVNPQK